MVTHNKLSSNTISSLISGNPLNTEMEIHHCEFQNGHDLYLRGDVWFHHNLINNFNDDAVFLQKQTGSNVKIHHNVFTRCLTCFSHAGNVLTALSFIYRNLIDLRLPTAGYRPLHPLATTESGEDRSEWRYGWLYKSDGNIGGVSYFHNTILAYTDKSHHSSFTHLLGSGNTVPRHSINNIFVAINHDELIRKSIMRFSSPQYPDITDGNLYYRIGLNNYPPFDYLGFSWQGITETEKRFDTLEAFRSSQLFILSKEHYLPGYESNSVFASPQFRRMQFDGILPFPLLPDDLRLRANSPARRKGILLPQPLRGYDQASDELLHPDIGCYVFNGPALKVGIDGSKSFP